jgi:hypothetical protein
MLCWIIPESRVGVLCLVGFDVSTCDLFFGGPDYRQELRASTSLGILRFACVPLLLPLTI